MYVRFVFEENAINNISVIIHTRSYLSTGMVRTGQSAEHYCWFVPYHQEVLRILPTGFDPAMSRTISGIETGRTCAMARRRIGRAEGGSD